MLGTEVLVTILVNPEALARLNAWIEVQPDPHPSRSEAAETLLQKALMADPAQGTIITSDLWGQLPGSEASNA